jgi:TonB family protein
LSLIAAVDEQGNVYDAQVISGPSELRAAALESVVKWHYARSPNSSGRVPITVHFQLPAEGPPPSNPFLQPDYDKPLGVLEKIDATALAESERETLLSRLPVRVRDTITPRTVDQTGEVAKDFDEHLRATWRGGKPDGDDQKNLTLLISYLGQTVNAERQATPQRIRVGGGVMARKLVSSVAPQYPQEARDKGVEGTVLLRVTVGKDGAVKEIEAIEGPSVLIPAALEAVKQWRYQVTQLNGEPVEVETEVSVNFSLGAADPPR